MQHNVTVTILANTTCIASLGGLPKWGKSEPRASPNNETNNALQANVTHGESDESSARQTKIWQARSCEWRHEKIESSLFVPVSFLPQFCLLTQTAIGQVRFFGSNRISKRQLSRFPHSTIFSYKRKLCSIFLSFYTLPFVESFRIKIFDYNRLG